MTGDAVTAWPADRVKPHGTPAAQQRHRRRNEAFCPACQGINQTWRNSKGEGNSWKQNWTKAKAQPSNRPVMRACTRCGARGPVNSKLKIGKGGFLCPDCR